MSNNLNKRVSRLEIVEDYLRCHDHITLYGRECTGRNLDFIKDLLCLMLWLWNDVSRSEELISKRWVDALLSTDVGEMFDVFKLLDTELIMSGNYASFKRKLDVYTPAMAIVLRPLRERLDTFFHEGIGLKDIRSALLFTSRGTLPESDFLEEEAFEKWSQENLSQCVHVDVSLENKIIRQWCKGITNLTDSFKPRYGPGHCADITGTMTHTKYLNFKYDSMLRYIGLKCGFGVDEMPRYTSGLERVGELRFVPKNLKVRRTINMEPSSLMFYQQGFFSLINERLFHGPLRNHIDLERPDLNGDLAWIGSMDGSYATIDLSSASDSVKEWLVRDLFNGTPLLKALIATRSRYVRYQDRVYQPNFFAPMGSALCFPVECIVFGAIVEGQLQSKPGKHNYRVYGDDIVCPTWAYDQVCQRLIQLGFQVNPDKSFGSPYAGFRESCGYEWFLGEDVRPLRVPRGFKSLRPKGTAILGLVDLANEAIHYPLLRLRVLRALKGCGVLFGNTGEGHVFSTQPTNFHLQKRWNKDLQREEYRSRSPVTRSDRWPVEDDDIRLFEWFRVREGRDVPVDVPATANRLVRSTYMKWGWHSPAPGWPTKGID